MTNEEANTVLVATQAMVGLAAMRDTNSTYMMELSKKLTEAVNIACDAIDLATEKDITIEKKDKDKEGDN